MTIRHTFDNYRQPRMTEDRVNESDVWILMQCNLLSKCVLFITDCFLLYTVQVSVIFWLLLLISFSYFFCSDYCTHRLGWDATTCYC